MDGIIKITDNEGKTVDRYSVYLKDGYMLLIDEHGRFFSDDWKQDYIDNDEGKEVEFENLPERVRESIVYFMAEEV